MKRTGWETPRGTQESLGTAETDMPRNTRNVTYASRTQHTKHPLEWGPVGCREDTDLKTRQGQGRQATLIMNLDWEERGCSHRFLEVWGALQQRKILHSQKPGQVLALGKCVTTTVDCWIGWKDGQCLTSSAHSGNFTPGLSAPSLGPWPFCPVWWHPGNFPACPWGGCLMLEGSAK